MDIHPLLVHFPIALLLTYAVLEFIRLKYVTQQPYWFFVKATLVITGSVSALAAYLTGDTAAERISDQGLRSLISSHELFAKLSLFVFGILAAGYTVAWIRTMKLEFIKNIPIVAQVWQVAQRVQFLITETKLGLFLAFVGTICLAITGALGGSIVYGPHNDPITEIIYNVFIGN